MAFWLLCAPRLGFLRRGSTDSVEKLSACKHVSSPQAQSSL